MEKLITIEEAVKKVKSGMTIMFGGFLTAGSANKILEALAETDVKDLTIIGNDSAYAGKGIGCLISKKKVKKAIISYNGANTDAVEQFNNKEMEIEFSPQGTLAERVRCGGAGLGGVITPTGIGTIVEEGKQKITLNGKEYLIEMPLHADVAILGASICDESGNLVYKGTTQNFNPMMATAADVVIVEAKNIVKTGSIPMEQVHTPALFVDYIVQG